MTEITIKKASGTWTVHAGGAIIGESKNALELCEAGHAPVIYFPRQDIATVFLDPSAQTSTCPIKGTASYYSIVTKSRTIENAAWSYEAPLPAAEQITGYLAFQANDLIIIERD